MTGSSLEQRITPAQTSLQINRRDLQKIKDHSTSGIKRTNRTQFDKKLLYFPVKRLG